MSPSRSAGRSIRGAVLEQAGRSRPFSASRPLHVAGLDLDPPGVEEVLVRIEAAGVCHSDLSVVNGSRPRPLPMLLGHEASGIIEEIGADVEDLQVGQRVTMTFLPRCGLCAGCRSEGRRPCLVGSAANAEGTLLGGHGRLRRNDMPIRHHLGVSAFATHAVVSRHSVVPVGADVPPAVAAVLGCALLTGGGAVLNVVRPRPETSVAIVGLGGVGMAALLTARALGVEHVVGVDAQPAKLETALRLGATATFSPEDAVARTERFDAVVEAAGRPSALEAAIALTDTGGTTVTVGLPAPGQKVAIDPLSLTVEARRIVGSYLGSSVPHLDIPVYERLWREGKLPVEDLISDTIALDDINEAMDRLADGLAIRQIISFE